jgi:hypothetical protein
MLQVIQGDSMDRHYILHRLKEINQELIDMKSVNANARIDDRIMKVIEMVSTLGDNLLITNINMMDRI